MRRTARRVAIGIAAGVVLALAAAGGVSAYWQAQQTVPTAVVTSGDLDIDAEWRDGTPIWSALYPGQSTPDTFITVDVVAPGDNLTWKLRFTQTVSPAFADNVTFRAWLGTCGANEPIPPEGVVVPSGTGELEVCVRYSLASDAPGSLQGQNINASINAHVDQVAP